MNTLEICTGTAESVRAAFLGGADRVELCSGLDEGGLTPSVGVIKWAVAFCKEQNAAAGAEGTEHRRHAVNVLIRPRGGDFLYTEAEQAVMIDDIRTAAALGADGIVVGALTAEGDVDVALCQRFVEAAGGCSLTFHRAFDVCRDPAAALEDIIRLGFHRVLTSGQAATAEEGIPVLQRLCRQAEGRISIMPGCGVNPQNAAHILYHTCAHELHASARAEVRSRMQFRRTGVEMGRADADEYARKETGISVVQQIRAAIDAVEQGE